MLWIYRIHNWGVRWDNSTRYKTAEIRISAENLYNSNWIHIFLLLRCAIEINREILRVFEEYKWQNDNRNCELLPMRCVYVRRDRTREMHYAYVYGFGGITTIIMLNAPLSLSPDDVQFPHTHRYTLHVPLPSRIFTCGTHIDYIKFEERMLALPCVVCTRDAGGVWWW